MPIGIKIGIKIDSIDIFTMPRDLQVGVYITDVYPVIIYWLAHS